MRKEETFFWAGETDGVDLADSEFFSTILVLITLSHEHGILWYCGCGLPPLT